MNNKQATWLAKLAWFLEYKVPKDHFDITSYIDIKDIGGNSYVFDNSNVLRYATSLGIKHIKDAASMIDVADDMGCGSTACALGWATCVLPFIKMKTYDVQSNTLGIRLVISNKGVERSVDTYKIASLFGIDVQECEFLFYRSVPITPVQEANEIKKILNKYGKTLVLHQTYMKENAREDRKKRQLGREVSAHRNGG